ncbi:glycosyltransferase family 39 protein [Haloplanus ruber]|uniref:Glycosyltransferase family 39 protein n=1 Tax=Haloplanus ruber TaxID=869892 RepID=A0ABD6CVZ3_9EURY
MTEETAWLGPRTYRLLAAALAIGGGLLVLLVATRLFPYHSLNHDEGVYLQQAAMLLDGQVFLRPPVAEAYRPWFFVRAPDGALYAKYAPVPAAMFAIGERLGGYRLALAGIAAGNLALTYTLVTEAFDRRRGLLAAAFLLVSPLFLIESAVFLPYAPTTLLNLAFAVAYFRAQRTGSLRAAAVAGLAVGGAFFARPYTAVLFATPVIVHALWTLRGLGHDSVARQTTTAAFGLVGVGAALGYNALTTGDPTVFPYEAFAPRDGLGFGQREILAYSREYTPELALRANGRVLALLFGEWVAAGPVGTLLAAVGVGSLLARLARDRSADPRRLVLAGLFVSVAAGNVYFWGNVNVLGDLGQANDGLVAHLGPYYHFDLLVPTAAFAAHGVVGGGERLRAALASRVSEGARRRRIGIAIAAVCLLAFAMPAATALASPVERNAEVTDTYRSAYAPVNGIEDGGLVFLPTPYGDWMNHPFQALRNDPDFDGDVVYALRERQFDVVDAHPGRTLYRYTYRGTWVPTAGETVRPRIQPVDHVAGDRVVLDLRLGVPPGVERVSIRLESEAGQAYYVTNGTPTLATPSLVVGDGRARLRGVTPVNGNATVPVDDRDDLQVTAFADYGSGNGFSYRLEVPTATEGDRTRALTPYVEVCRQALRCGGEAAYIPDAARDGVVVEHDLRATNATASADPALTAASAGS